MITGKNLDMEMGNNKPTFMVMMPPPAQANIEVPTISERNLKRGQDGHNLPRIGDNELHARCSCILGCFLLVSPYRLKD